jgi:hypothetical protein
MSIPDFESDPLRSSFSLTIERFLLDAGFVREGFGSLVSFNHKDGRIVTKTEGREGGRNKPPSSWIFSFNDLCDPSLREECREVGRTPPTFYAPKRAPEPIGEAKPPQARKLPANPKQAPRRTR